MTSSVTVVTLPTSKKTQFEVRWSTGARVQGILYVDLDVQVVDAPVAAELCALHHLLEINEVCGAGRAGRSLTITCSYSAIRKLAEAKSDKAQLAPYALFLRTRFADARILCYKDLSWFVPDIARNRVQSIVVHAPPLSVMTFPDGFKAGLTQHALEAYMVRWQNFVPSHAWLAIRASVESPQTILVNVTPEEHSRHGKQVRAYSAPSGLRLIVVDDPLGAMILTCYYVPIRTHRPAHA